MYIYRQANFNHWKSNLRISEIVFFRTAFSCLTSEVDCSWFIIFASKTINRSLAYIFNHIFLNWKSNLRMSEMVAFNWVFSFWACLRSLDSSMFTWYERSRTTDCCCARCLSPSMVVLRGSSCWCSSWAVEPRDPCSKTWINYVFIKKVVY